jgi:hypothetical protein
MSVSAILLVFGWKAHAGGGIPPDPIGYLVRADVVALAVFRGASQHGGDNLTRLEIVDVVRGNVSAKEIEVVDSERGGPVSFLPPVSKGLKDGARVGVCLVRDSSGRWTLSDVQLLAYPKQVEAWPRVGRRFFAVLDAAKADDPSRRYRELLPMDGEILLDLGASRALDWTKDPHAAEVLREMLRRVLESPRPLQSNDCARPEGLIRLLESMHDTKSMELAMKYIASLPVGKRGYMYDCIPGLARGADAETIRKAMVKLKPLLDQLPDEETIRRSKDAGLSKDYIAGHEAYKRLEVELLQATK